MDALYRSLLAIITVASLGSMAEAMPFQLPRFWELDRLNAGIKGHVCDFTHNHGADHRMWSPALGEKRDMYVYLPPGYDGVKQYPLMIWLHGFSQDEKNSKSLSRKLDAAIVCGKLPPMVIAVPDGTFKGQPTIRNSGSFFLNGVRGRYEDYLIQDVWNFLMCHFAIRPERDAHVLAGASMGGTSVFNLAFKHKDMFGVIVGIMPLLDLLYADCHGNHFAQFDPNCLGRIEHYDPRASAGRVMGINIKYGKAMKPLFGEPACVEKRLPEENPVEMLSIYDIRPEDFKIFIAWTEGDQFNGNNEARSFLYYANQRGIQPDVVTEPTGKHNSRTGMKFFERFVNWLAPLVAPYAPCN
jgi:S-formylglutathione hydrolase FrmB